MELASAIATLNLFPGEASLAAKGGSEKQKAALQAMDDFASAQDPAARLDASAKLAQTANSVLISAVEAIHAQREKLLQDTLNDLTALVKEYQSTQVPATPEVQHSLAMLSDRLTVVEQHVSASRPSDLLSTTGQLRTRSCRARQLERAETKRHFTVAASCAAALCCWTTIARRGKQCIHCSKLG